MNSEQLQYARYKLAELLRLVQQHMRSEAHLMRAEADELDRVAKELQRG